MPEKLFQRSCLQDAQLSKGILQTFKERNITSSDHGFVRAVYLAYSHHHHLKLRPEDVWFSILTQLSFFINGHAEELRSLFVSHESKKELNIGEVGNIHSVDFGELAIRMTSLIEENVNDPELRAWIMPDFSTTESDRVVAAIPMMGSLQEYLPTQCVCSVVSRLSLYSVNVTTGLRC